MIAAFIATFATATPLLAAGTVTIVDGPNTPPDGTKSVFNDAYIQNYLNITNSLTLDTADSTIGGVNEIRVESGAVITWTSGNSLTLSADANIVVSGTIQHDGPNNGNGGVALLAGGDVLLGLGTQPSAIDVGSRYGLTRVVGQNVRLTAANSGTDGHTQLGYYNISTAISTTGPISVSAAVSVTGQAGGGDRSYVQIGHAGSKSTYQSSTGTFAGDIDISAGDSIHFMGGSGDIAFAQIGNGGAFGDGSYAGSHTLLATNSITFTGGSGGQAYVQVGNGGLALYEPLRYQSGDHTLIAQNGNIAFTSGSGSNDYSYAVVGNGGRQGDGESSGNHSLYAANDILFTSQPGASGFVQVGNGGDSYDGYMRGDLSVVAGRNIIFTADSEEYKGFAQIGHGGTDFQLSAGYPQTITGNITVVAQTGYISFTSGAEWSYSKIGTQVREGNIEGSILVTASLGITFAGGTGEDAFTQIGHGTTAGSEGGSFSGDITVSAGEDIVFLAGAEDAYAVVGHTGYGDGGILQGDVTLTTGGDALFTAGYGTDGYAQAGHSSFEGDELPSGNVTISALSGDIVFTAGTEEATYVLAGHGGYNNYSDGGPSNNTLLAGGSITFTASAYDNAFAQAGNTGSGVAGISTDLTLTTLGGAITFLAGQGNSYRNYAIAGNGGYNPTSPILGNITLNSATDVIFTAGSSDSAFAMAGNGGLTPQAPISGSVTITATGSISFTAGNENEDSFAMVGNGGNSAELLGVDTGGNHSLWAGGNIAFLAGDYEENSAWVGNGGYDIDANHSGDHTLYAGKNIIFTAGTDYNASAYVGNGGYDVEGNVSGSHSLTAGQSIFFTAGSADETAAYVGNAAEDGNGDRSGDHTLTALAGDIVFLGGTEDDASVQVGNGGESANGTLSGNHSLRAGGNITFTAGSGEETFAQVGNGAEGADGSSSGNHALIAGGNIAFTAGSEQGTYTQVGNGSFNSAGNITGTITLSATQDIVFSAGSTDTRTYARIGNGDDSSTGTRGGNITLWSGEDVVLQGANIGHFTEDGVNAITDANTYIAVSQNNPLVNGTGSIVATNTPLYTVSFNSAPLANDGELRFYVPREQNVSILAGTSMNSETYPGNVPMNRMAGSFFFADGPYIQDYSFYFAPPSDLGITKQVQPSGNLLPGQPLTYTLAFTNSGFYTATNVVLTDTLPVIAIVNVSLDSDLDPGVTITQTGSAPNLAWEISDLGPGQGGVIVVRANATTQVAAPIGFANRTAITGTLDITPTNNSALVNSSINVPFVGFAPTAYSVLENAGSVVLTVTLSFTNPYTSTLVTYIGTDGTASASSDYGAQNGALTIPAGQSSVTLTVPITDDTQMETSELFTVTLVTAFGAGPYFNTQAAVTILDNESALSVAALDADKAEGNSGTTDFTFVVSRTGYLTSTVTVDYAVSGVADGADFAGNALPSGTVTFNSGEASRVITATVQGDLLAEGDEAFTVTLSNASAGASITTASAAGTIRNDDIAPALTVSKAASVSLARVGETITYTVRITNSGGLTFTAISAVDDQLGPVTLDKSSLNLGEVAMGELTYTVASGDLNGPLVNTVTVTGTPMVGDDVVATANTSVALVNAAFAFTKTVGIEGITPECTDNGSMQVPVSTTVVYCFTITNNGTEPLTSHTLEDDQLGTLLNGATFTVAPGASFSTSVTRTLYASVTNTAVWTAGYAGSDTVSIAALPAQSTTQATVIISDDDDDQDEDGIPDNLELAGDFDGDNEPNFLDLDSDGDGRLDSAECSTHPCVDSDGDGSPDFLDPDSATGLDPDAQPGDGGWLFLPSIEN